MREEMSKFAIFRIKFYFKKFMTKTFGGGATSKEHAIISACAISFKNLNRVRHISTFFG